MDVLVGTKNGLFVNGERSEGSFGQARIDWIERVAGGWLGVTNGSSVFRRTEAGVTEVLAHSHAERLNCVIGSPGGILAGGAEASMFEVKEGALLRRSDFQNARGRSDWYTPWGGPPDVRSMAVGADGVVYVNVHVGGVLVGSGGEGWAATMDIHADVHQVVAHRRRSGVVVAATARGLALSLDGAQSWRFRTDGLHATYCRAAAIDDDAVFFSASAGSQGRRAAVYRTDLSGGPIERVHQGLPAWFTSNVDTRCIDARDGWVVIADEAGTVYAATDPGFQFDVLLEGLPGITCIGIL